MEALDVAYRVPEAAFLKKYIIFITEGGSEGGEIIADRTPLKAGRFLAGVF